MKKRRRARAYSKKLSLSSVLLFTFFVAILFLLQFTFFKKHSGSPLIATIQQIPTSIPLRLPSPTPTPTVIPTPSPTPTPAIPAGFCLRVPVLLYHHIQPTAQAVEKHQQNLSVDNGMFDLQMGYLATHGYTTITVKQLVDALRTHSSLPSKSIAVTLDDGYRDWYTYVYPVFQKYHLTGNLMISTGLLEGADYLTWGQLKEMIGSGLFYVTDHTWSHYGVGGGNREKIKYEIETARQQLEDGLGQKIEIFTYPYGTVGNVALQVLKEDGFTSAFTTIPGTYQCDSIIMTLHRTRVGNSPLYTYGF